MDAKTREKPIKPMNRISAAENLIIEHDDQSWRLLLLYRETGEEKGLLEARSGRPLRYARNFAGTRRLPANGTLPLDYVWQVVLGWSHDDDAWHLGLLLATDLADARGSRWCELAYWPDPDPTVFGEMARDAAQQLAAVLQTPFNLVPPRPAGKRQPEAPPLPPLPLEIGMWQLEREAGGQLQLRRGGQWMRSQVRRLLWYGFWTVAFVVLSITTLTSDLALPNSGTLLPDPSILPYLGLGVAALLAGQTLWTVYQMLTKPNRIVIDSNQHAVTALRGDNQRWYKNGTDLDSVYVTQVVNRRAENNTVYYAEINLHLHTGDFKTVVQQDSKEEINHEVTPAEGIITEDVIPLTRFEVTSDVQAAGLTIAEELGGIPCWYDRRTR